MCFFLCIDSSAEMSALMATLKENLTLARKMREQKRLESTASRSRKVPGIATNKANYSIMS